MRRPCATCPWQRTTPRDGFPGGRIDAYRLLRMLEDRIGKVMQCHSTPDGEDAEVCVGFAARVGRDSFSYRLAVLVGAVDEDDLDLRIDGLLTLPDLLRRHGGRSSTGGKE